jgi:lipopolysaccharide transport system ATP-binding protein
MRFDSQNRCEAEPVVQLEGITKTFPVERHRATAYTTVRKQLRGGRQSRKTFDALRDINLAVFQGEKIGIVGDNGSGKTTLLKIIAGLYAPSSGHLETRGELALLVGLGTGMVAELNVEDNVFLYGAIYGLPREAVAKKLDEIIEWAEVQGFEGAKLKTLSSGMRTRLAFSVTRHIDKDIYLLDEALTAGDKNFHQKCESVFQRYKESHKTFLVSTHDHAFVSDFCEKTLWLHKGRRMAFGETEYVLKQYHESSLH